MSKIEDDPDYDPKTEAMFLALRKEIEAKQRGRNNV
jgi:hypothetical protein